MAAESSIGVVRCVPVALDLWSVPAPLARCCSTEPRPGFGAPSSSFRAVVEALSAVERSWRPEPGPGGGDGAAVVCAGIGATQLDSPGWLKLGGPGPQCQGLPRPRSSRDRVGAGHSDRSQHRRWVAATMPRSMPLSFVDEVAMLAVLERGHTRPGSRSPSRAGLALLARPADNRPCTRRSGRLGLRVRSTNGRLPDGVAWLAG